MLDLLAPHTVPRPTPNAVLAGFGWRVEVEFLFEDRGVIVEADGARYHDSRQAREADAAKQAMLEAAGFRVVRVTWAHVTHDGAQTARRIRRALG